MVLIVTLVAISLSFLMGIAYLALGLAPQLRAAERSGQASYPHYYELASAPIFVLSQGIATVLLWQEDPAFLYWILPPAFYLLSIGLLCWHRFGRKDMLGLDTGRGLVLIGLSFLAWSQLSRSAV